MAPNTGQGGNCAIEVAAALASLLRKLVQDNPSGQPSLEQIQDTLQKYQNKRYTRMNQICIVSWIVLRIHALDGLLFRLIARYVTQWNQDLQAKMLAKISAGGETIDFLPIPTVSSSKDVEHNRKARPGVRPCEIVTFLITLVTQSFVWVFHKARNAL